MIKGLYSNQFRKPKYFNPAKLKNYYIDNPRNIFGGVVLNNDILQNIINNGQFENVEILKYKEMVFSIKKKSGILRNNIKSEEINLSDIYFLKIENNDVIIHYNYDRVSGSIEDNIKINNINLIINGDEKEFEVDMDYLDIKLYEGLSDMEYEIANYIKKNI